MEQIWRIQTKPRMALWELLVWRPGAGLAVAALGHANNFFTITAEIHARSLANFYGQYAERHMNSTIYYRKKQIDVSF